MLTTVHHCCGLTMLDVKARSTLWINAAGHRSLLLRVDAAGREGAIDDGAEKGDAGVVALLQVCDSDAVGHVLVTRSAVCW